MLFSEAVKSFLQHLSSLNRSKMTIHSYSRDLHDFECFTAADFNGPVYVEEVSTVEVDSFLHHLSNRNLASSTRQRAVVAIKSFFTFCFKKGIVSVNVAATLDNVRVEHKERNFLTHAEALQLFGAINKPIVKVFTQTLYYTGLRLSEALGLTMADVDMVHQIIKVRQGKGKKDRMVPISDSLKNVLGDYLTWRPNMGTDLLFVSKSGSLSQSYVDLTLKKAAKELGWTKKLSPHILRHSFASNLVRQNVNIVHISRLLGHASLATTSIYTHSNLDELTKAVNSM